MSFAMYGVNTRIRSEVGCLVASLAFWLVISGCSGEQGTRERQASAVTDTVAEMQAIEESLNAVLDRLRLGDKAGLYENEFSYLTDEANFDDYLKRGEISWAHADTIEHLYIRSIRFFREHDSARAEVEVRFKGLSGKESSIFQNIPIYYFNGRWIKPTISTRFHQDEYDELIRIADSAAAAEDELLGEE